MRETAFILLAAGQGRRMGRAKQLLDHGGKPLVVHALDEILGTGAKRVMVVTGAHFEAVEAVLQGKSAEVVRNPHWESGMASSIRTGVEAALGRWSELGGLAICLADQPLLCAGHYAQLLEAAAAHPGKVAAAEFEGVLGAPAVFPRQFAPQLCGLAGDQGAGKWLRGNLDLVVGIEMREAGMDWDFVGDV